MYICIILTACFLLALSTVSKKSDTTAGPNALAGFIPAPSIGTYTTHVNDVVESAAQHVSGVQIFNIGDEPNVRQR